MLLPKGWKLTVSLLVSFTMEIKALIFYICCIVNLYLEQSYILESLTCKLHQYKLAIGLELNQSVLNQADQKLNVESTSLHI